MKSTLARKTLGIALGMCLLLGSIAGAGTPKYEWNAALNSVEDTIPYIVAAEFKRLLEERSNGEIVLTLYPAGQLGGDIEMSEGVMSGNIEFACCNPSNLVSLVPKAAIFDLHNIFSDLEHCRRTIDGPFLEAVKKVFSEKNIYVPGFSDIGFRKLMSNRKVEKLEDMAGLKIRVMENKHQIAYWKSLGANPTPMDWGEVYIGLQQGTIDANEQPYDFIVSNKLYEVQKYLAETDHLMQYVILFMNQQIFDSLPADVRKLVDQAGRDACVYGRRQTDIRAGQKKQFLVDYGMVFTDIPAEMKQKMYELSGESRALVRQSVGAELYDFYMECVEKAR